MVKKTVAPPIIATKDPVTVTRGPVLTPAAKQTNALAYSTIVSDIWSSYLKETPQSLKLIDAFMAFLVYTGVVQFLYCIIVGNYPFNAFLSGFAATIGQFVLAGETIKITRGG